MAVKAPKQKGSGYERELHRELTATFAALGVDIDTIRVPLSGALADQPGDLLLRTGAHSGWVAEAKRTERPQLYAHWAQAVRQCTGRLKPVLITRRNRHESLAIIRLTDFAKLLACAQMLAESRAESAPETQTGDPKAARQDA